MKKFKLKLIAIFIIWAALSLFSTVEAITPPCQANAYLTRYDVIGGVVKIEYFQDNEFACSQNLSKTYAVSPQMVGYTPLNESTELNQSIDYLIELLTFGFYFAIALTVAGVFISGIKIMNS